MSTRIVVEPGRVRLRHGLLRAQQTNARPGWVRIGLVATTALLLGGDHVDLEVSVGPGARLDLFDVGGTVAYDGRGSASCWQVRVAVASGSMLRWRGQPFVVSDGADVSRSLDIDADSAAVVAMQETLVLGRSGQLGGRLRNRTTIRVGHEPVLIEDQMLDPAGMRTLPGVLGAERVIDTVTWLGAPDPQAPAEGTARFRLLRHTGTITRFLGSELAASPLSLLSSELEPGTVDAAAH